MIKKNLKILLIASAVILLPMLVGLILWDQLPAQIPGHWNVKGEVDGWLSKPVSVFGVPLILLGLQWLCVFGTLSDPKRANHSDKVFQLVIWLVPAISVILHVPVYMTALGKEVRVEMIAPVVIGVIFMLLGNYMPKCKQNYTIGIKIPWTLNSEENWNRTHRFAGKLWMVCGLCIFLTGFLGSIWITFGAVLLMVILPIAYSYMLHRKGI